MAAAAILGISPELVIHPGETISDILEERNLTQKELAQRAGVSEAFLSDVIHGKKDISKRLAMGLEYALGVPSSFWLNLQANYDAELISLQEETTIQKEERQILTTLHEVVDYLKKIASIPNDATQEQTILGLRKVLQISNLTVLQNLAPSGAFRMSEKAKVDPFVLGAWLCLCKVQSSLKQFANGFDPRKVNELILRLKDIMCSRRGDLQQALISLFAEYGIDFSIVRNFRGAPVQGYIDFKEDGSYQMVVTIRGAYADIFWFSLFHELGHIVNGDIAKPGRFIDTEDPQNAKREEEANRFARDALLDPADYRAFIDRGRFTLPLIQDFAKTQNVPPYVVIGRLQREERIPYSWYNKYKTKYKWAE